METSVSSSCQAVHIHVFWGSFDERADGTDWLHIVAALSIFSKLKAVGRYFGSRRSRSLVATSLIPVSAQWLCLTTLSCQTLHTTPVSILCTQFNTSSPS